jgi:hypothetical protein
MMNNNPESALNEMFNDARSHNSLLAYLQNLDGQVTNQLSQPSPEALQVMEHQVLGTLGHLPPSQFDVNITTTRENLGRLLASAMVSGYFLHRAEQRMSMEKQFAIAAASNNEDN